MRGAVFSVWSGDGHSLANKAFISSQTQEIKDAIELGMAVNVAVIMAI